MLFRSPLPPLTVEVLGVHKEISHLRSRLIAQPNNPYALGDMAFAYGKIGQLEKAKQCILRALILAPEDRLLLRSASRLYTHSGEPDVALQILRKSERLRQDPWILAAEIAISDLAKETSRYAKRGKKIVEAKITPPYHTSELAGAVGTLELDHGNIRKSKKFFKSALIDPTENVVAQTEWAITHQNLNINDFSLQELPGVYEANSIKSYFEGDWEDALNQTKLWHLDQPFSIGATALGSYIASLLLNRDDDAISIAKGGVVANPRKWILRNNLAVSYAKLGLIDEAEAEMEIANHYLDDAEARGVLLATNGIISFRKGDFVKRCPPLGLPASGTRMSSGVSCATW